MLTFYVLNMERQIAGFCQFSWIYFMHPSGKEHVENTCLNTLKVDRQICSRLFSSVATVMSHDVPQCGPKLLLNPVGSKVKHLFSQEKPPVFIFKCENVSTSNKTTATPASMLICLGTARFAVTSCRSSLSSCGSFKSSCFLCN